MSSTTRYYGNASPAYNVHDTNDTLSPHSNNSLPRAYTVRTVDRDGRTGEEPPAHSTMIGAREGRALCTTLRIATTTRPTRAVQPSQAKAIMAVSMRQGSNCKQKLRLGQMLCGSTSETS